MQANPPITDSVQFQNFPVFPQALGPRGMSKEEIVLRHCSFQKKVITQHLDTVLAQGHTDLVCRECLDYAFNVVNQKMLMTHGEGHWALNWQNHLRQGQRRWDVIGHLRSEKPHLCPLCSKEERFHYSPADLAEIHKEAFERYGKDFKKYCEKRFERIAFKRAEKKPGYY